MLSLSQSDGRYMDDFIERTLKERRTLEGVLADLVAKYERISLQRYQQIELGRMIQWLEEEIALRNKRRER